MGQNTFPSRHAFIKSIGALGAVNLTAAAFGCSSSVTAPATPSGVPPSGAPPQPQTYRSAAEAGFELLVTQYKTPHIFDGNFWFGGTTLHTCLNYLVAARQTDKSAQILPAAYAVYRGLHDKPGWWKDDYGWWGVAFAFAIEHRRALGYGSAAHDGMFHDLLAAAESCWEQIAANWRDYEYNYEVRHGWSDNAAAYVPEIIGGTFNHAPDSTSPPLSGRNSVTNEGFWILSQRLERLIPMNKRYDFFAGQERWWFTHWLTYPKRHRGAAGILNEAGLVLERPTGNEIDPAWFWSGDQGLFIQALGNNGALANSIAAAVVANMTDASGVLHENVQFLKFPDLQTFAGDYGTGKGIFMRNFMPLLLANPGRYASFVKSSASAVWCNRSSGNQFTYNWNPAAGGEPAILRVAGKSDALCNLIMQGAGLEALTAAVSVAPTEKITC